MGNLNKLILFFCTTFLMSSNVAFGQIESGLVLHATFDIDASDSGPMNYHGSLIGAIISQESAIGIGAAYFDGLDDYIEFPPNVAYFKGNYSISIWAKMESCRIWSRILDFNQDKPGSGNSVTWLIGRPGHTQNNMWFDQWVVYENNPVESIIDIRRMNPADAYLGYDIVPQKWTHYVITYNSKSQNHLGIQVNTKDQKVPLEGEVTLFVDGEKISTSNFCLNPQGEPTTANWLGRSRFDADPYYKGYMDDFRIYDRVLSENEITELFKMRK